MSFLTDLAVFSQAVPADDRLLRRQRHRFRAGVSGADAGSPHEFLLQFYAALAAGRQLANHKMALSVAFFFAFQFVVQMAGAIVLVLLDEGRCTSSC